MSDGLPWSSCRLLRSCRDGIGCRFLIGEDAERLIAGIERFNAGFAAGHQKANAFLPGIDSKKLRLRPGIWGASFAPFPPPSRNRFRLRADPESC